jgi:ABC-type nickel/cobalt efflux system permease component RcnA
MTVRRAALLAGLCVALVLTATVHAQTPGPRPPRSSEGSSVASAPAWLRPALLELERLQRQLNLTLSRNMRQVGREGSAGAALIVLGVAFAYGVLHAAGPGHGKAVIASFYLGREAHWLRGVAAGFAMSLLQILVSIGLVALLAIVLGYSGLDVGARAVWVEVVSYGLIVLVGLYLLWGGVRGGHALAHADPSRSRTSAGVVLAAGLTPCPSAIVILLFALANGVFLFGIGASLVMAVGMGLTVSLVGLLTILARRATLSPLGPRHRLYEWAQRALALLSGLAVTALGAWLLAGALGRLP